MAPDQKRHHLQARSLIGQRPSKFIHSQIDSNVKTCSAKRLPVGLIREAASKTLSIQVDGGSEFMAEFEAACKDMHIPLEILARKPACNGIERGNRIFKEAFHDRRDLLADSLGALRYELKKSSINITTTDLIIGLYSGCLLRDTMSLILPELLHATCRGIVCHLRSSKDRFSALTASLHCI